jgi:hypothetical protein
LKYTDPTGHKQVCERGDEGIEGEFDEGIEGKFNSSRCGSGATTEQIAKAFDKKHSKYSAYYAQIHEVVIDLEAYLGNRTSIYENRLRSSIEIARRMGFALHIDVDQDAWKSTKEFPKILGGGYVMDEGSGTTGGDYVAGSGEFSDYSLSDIIDYYRGIKPRTQFPRDDWMHIPTPDPFPGDDWMHNP